MWLQWRELGQTREEVPGPGWGAALNSGPNVRREICDWTQNRPGASMGPGGKLALRSSLTGLPKPSLGNAGARAGAGWRRVHVSKTALGTRKSTGQTQDSAKADLLTDKDGRTASTAPAGDTGGQISTSGGHPTAR